MQPIILTKAYKILSEKPQSPVKPPSSEQATSPIEDKTEKPRNLGDDITEARRKLDELNRQIKNNENR